MGFRRRGVRSSSQSGQSLILAVIGMATLMGMAAMAIDVGLVFHERREAQNAADAAALAGAASLPPYGTSFQAAGKAHEWAELNGYTDGVASTTVTVTYPFDGDGSRLEVEIERPYAFTFGKVLGLDQLTVSARAVGQGTFTTGGGGGYAIFVINNNCNTSDPLEVSGSLNDVTGDVHSNSKIKIGGSNVDFVGDTTYSCSFTDGGANNTFTPPPAQFGNRPSPLDYAYGSFPCTYSFTQDIDVGSRPELWLNDDPGTKELKDAVICSTGDIQLSGQDVTGNVTFVAGDELKISGSNFQLQGFWNDVLAFSAAAHEAAIDMSGSGGLWEGYIFAPNGRAKVAGQDGLSVQGSIIADRVSISGSDFSINSTDDAAVSPGPGTVKLVE